MIGDLVSLKKWMWTFLFFLMMSPLKTITGVTQVSSTYEVIFAVHTHFS
tara:strand:+ start:644 stop:790 length:147 start_codon:yes stop_codon:yes gene_type:complete